MAEPSRDPLTSDETRGSVKAKVSADRDPDIWKVAAYAFIVFRVYIIVTLGKKAVGV